MGIGYTEDMNGFRQGEYSFWNVLLKQGSQSYWLIRNVLILGTQKELNLIFSTKKSLKIAKRLIFWEN
jgi:hypothetical protein